jgi:hypothetical protein
MPSFPIPYPARRLLPWSWLVAGLCCLLVLAVCRGQGVAQGPGSAKKGPTKSLPVKDALPPWPIVGAGNTSKDSEEEALKYAKDDALEAACKKVQEYLRAQDPPILWTPASLGIVKKQLFADSPRRLPETEVEKRLRLPPVGKGKWLCWEWTLHLSAEQLTALRQEEKRYRAEMISAARHQQALARMEALAEFTAWSVLVLAAVFVYLRVDQWTAGTKRGWLRLALASLLGSGIGWWLLS